MTSIQTTVTGVVHGKTIELQEETGLPEGQAVAVSIRPLTPSGEGIRLSAGGWEEATGDEFRQWMGEIQKGRESMSSDPPTWVS